MVKKKKKQEKNTKELIKYFVIVILIFSIGSFIDFRLGVFMAVISISIIVTRRTIFNLNPGYIEGHKILHKGKELSISKGIDVFNLNNSVSINSLYEYVEVIQGVAIPPQILIIRFTDMHLLKHYDLAILNKVIRRLKTNKIEVIFSDVKATLQNQIRQSEIAQKVGEENIFYYINDALKRAHRTLIIS